MSKTTIEWTDYTWNPMRGCSPDMRCAPTCWAVQMANRHEENPNTPHLRGFAAEGKWTGKVALISSELDRPLHWRRPRRIAVGLMGDWMRLSDDDRIVMLSQAALARQHTYQFLTKLPSGLSRFMLQPDLRDDIEDEAHEYMDQHEELDEVLLEWPALNWWLGVSILDQSDADKAREPMRRLAAAGWRTWVSHEPAWGGIDWKGWEFLAYMVSGGQTGPGAPPSHPEWFRADRDFCSRRGIPWGFKQWGEWAPLGIDEPQHGAGMAIDRGYDIAGVSRSHAMHRVGKKRAGRLLDGREHLEMPEVQSA
jgi:protein gp37